MTNALQGAWWTRLAARSLHWTLMRMLRLPRWAQRVLGWPMQKLGGGWVPRGGGGQRLVETCWALSKACPRINLISMSLNLIRYQQEAKALNFL